MSITPSRASGWHSFLKSPGSPKFFSQLFRKKFGKSPKEYVTTLKIERAKELLSGEKLTISQIGSMLGFSDIYHFSKVFHATTGETTRFYRNQRS